MLRKVAKRALKRATRNSYRPLNWIELDKARLLHNIVLFRQQHPNMAIFPVLKGNAYGHGLEEVVTILNDATIEMIAVDGYFEAAKIRDISRHRLLVMGYILPDNVRLLDTKRCSFVVQDVAALKAFASLRRPVKIHLELNTGMNRLGLQPNELETYLEALKSYPTLELEGVMTHLADADNPNENVFSVQQTKKFDSLVEQILKADFQPKYVHIAQTAGSTKVKSRYANALRIGVGTYGITPLQPDDERATDLVALQPVLELKSTIIKVMPLNKGDKVSYNGIFTALKAMRIGVLPLGYYEGVPRALSNHGYVTVDGQQLPIVGRVCMNHTMIDLTGTDLGVGNQVTVISSDSNQPNSVLGLQQKYGLFAYETLARLTPHMKRRIV